MFPIRDHNPSGKFPLITFLLIAANVYIFILEVTSPDTELFIRSYALIPKAVDLLDPVSLQPFVSSMFLHGGWFHLLSNMWFLWIFGDNVEAQFGKIRYILFYLFCGIFSAFIQYLTMVSSDIPILGASGAIAGVLGAYQVFFPRARIETMIVLGWYITTVQIPASFMLGYWFITQLFSGIASVAVDTVAAIGGVAFMAHAAGFAGGYLVAKTSRNSQAI